MKIGRKNHRTLHIRVFLPIIVLTLVISIISGATASSHELNILTAQPVSQNPPFDYIVTMMFENHPLNGSSGIINHSSYIASLANQYGLAANYLDASGTGSEPNYLAAISGKAPCNDTEPVNCQLGDPTIVSRIEASGRAWKVFMEDYQTDRGPLSTGGCSLAPTNAGYLSNHNPFIYYKEITNNTSRCKNILPANSNSLWWKTAGAWDDLFLNYLNTSSPANYIWLGPDHCNSMHGNCSTTGDPVQNQIHQGNDYLSKLVPKILGSRLFQTGRAVLYLTWDEPTTDPTTHPECPNPVSNPLPGSEPCQVPGLWIGPMVKKGYVSNTLYNHYSYLRTIEDAWGLAALAKNDQDAAPMTDFFLNTDAYTLKPQSPTINISPENGYTRQAISFDVSVANGIATFTYNWSFGDDAAIAGKQTTHSYNKPGIYNVTLTVTDSNNKVFKTFRLLAIDNPTPLRNLFDYSPATPLVNSVVSFNASTSGGLPPYSNTWNYGDGSIGHGSSANHTYSTPGSYQLSSLVKDSLGQTVLSSTTINILAPSVMTGSFSSSPIIPTAGQNVMLEATVTNGMAPFTYRWNLGDDTLATGPEVVHYYQRPGEYNATLTVVDANHASSTAAHKITVVPSNTKLASSFNYSSTVSSQTSLVLIAHSIGGVAPYSYSWTLGDGPMTYSGRVIRHTYSKNGTYMVTLTTTDGQGARYTTANALTIGRKTPTNPVDAQSTSGPTSNAHDPQLASTVTQLSMRILLLIIGFSLPIATTLYRFDLRTRTLRKTS